MPRILIEELPDDTPSPARAAAKELLKMRRQFAESIVQQHAAIRARLWASHDASPADILQELGTNAAAFFREGGLLVQFLMQTGAVQLEESDYLPPIPYTANPDGTVTLNP